MAEEKKKNWFAKHKILTGILVLIVIGVIASASSSDKSKIQNANNKKDQNQPAAQTQNEASKKAEIAKIGVPARDGKFEFTVQSMQCGKASVGSNEFLTKTPQGQFCLLNLTVKNIGNEAQSLLSSNQYLLNDSGQKYSADDTATMYNAPNGTSWYNQINPGNSVEGAIVFDIPKDVTPTMAQLHDSAFSGGIQVSLN